jgi:5-methylcytosine-specific restriction endonuclease McrA
MHPWFNTSFTERKKCHAEFKKWLKENPLLRYKHGYVREDGKVFCGYSTGYANGEHWTEADTFERRLAHAREKMRLKRLDPKYRAEFRDYIKNHYKNADMRNRKTAIRKKKWSQENKPRLALKSSSRRTLKRNLLHADHDFSIEEQMRKSAAALTQQTGIEHDIDHIIPIKHGGWHHHENLQILPSPVNKSKSSSPFWVSSEYKDFRSVPQSLWPESLNDFYLAIQST